MPKSEDKAPDSDSRVKVIKTITLPKESRLLVDEAQEPSFWAKAGAWAKKYLLAPLPILIIVVVGIILVALGFKNIQIGGLIGKLLGRDGGKGTKAIDKANTIPPDRVDKDGNLIPIGEADSKGLTQAKVLPIEPPSVWDDPTKVKIIEPGKDEPTEVILPDGVKAKDVDRVLIIKPEVHVVTVKDKSKVTASDVDDLLAKYGDEA